ncbi:hypothetical protein BPOR_1375g00010 [Botrytis porri]|uniref:Uncharacterized protein n=1 Tax=Botrytis porri TaxID=87229 RepID=A0A4Z1KA96_9HELO|nr:hypothetical protein BPOR_1375g00010 [Botrytis porri]
MASNSTPWMNTSSWSPSRTSTKNPFDDSNEDPFDDMHATPLQDIETSTTARLSSETQQRDAADQSGALSEEERIIEDIRNERIVTCGIASLAMLLLTIDVRYYGPRQNQLEGPLLGNVPNVKILNDRAPRENAGVKRVAHYMTTLPSRTRALMVFTIVGQNVPMETSHLAESHATQGHASMNVEVIIGIRLMFATFRIVGGPDIQWYNQMKDSCHGFNTRVEIGTRFAASTYTLHSLNASIDNQTFYLAPVLAPKFGSKEPYQYFHRFSGNTTNTANFAIDVDVDNGVWREVHFDGTDELTKWWASGRKQYPSVHPVFDNITTIESATKLNGTFVIRDGHLWMPDFDLIIQGLEDSRKHAEIEPFIRVFDTQGLPHSRTEKLLSPKWNWNNRYDPNIVMRTASSGHGRQRLDMCIKENFYYASSGAQQKLDGVSDGSIMPLAVIAAFRMRMNEMYALKSGRPFNTKKYSEYDDVKRIA